MPRSSNHPKRNLERNPFAVSNLQNNFRSTFSFDIHTRCRVAKLQKHSRLRRIYTETTLACEACYFTVFAIKTENGCMTNSLETLVIGVRELVSNTFIGLEKPAPFRSIFTV